MARSGLSKTQIQQTARQTIAGMQYTYSGPLPHPEILEQYDRIVPGGAERIFAQFEAQATHRHKIEADVVSSNSFSQRCGAITAPLIGILVTTGGLYLVHEGKDLWGLATVITALASLVGVFIYGRQSQNNERKGKQS